MPEINQQRQELQTREEVSPLIIAAAASIAKQQRAQPVYLVSGLGFWDLLLPRILVIGIPIGVLVGTVLMLAIDSKNKQEIERWHELMDPIQASQQAEIEAEEADLNRKIAAIDEKLKELNEVSTRKMVTTSKAFTRSIRSEANDQDLAEARRQEAEALEAERSAKVSLAQREEELRAESGRRLAEIYSRYERLHAEAEAQLEAD